MKSLTSVLLLLGFCLGAFAADADPPKEPMTLESFADSTIEVIKEDGIDEYLPTIALSKINELRVIDGIPENIDHKEAIQNVVRRSGYDSQEFFWAVLSSPGVITLGHSKPGQATRFMMITKEGERYKAAGTKDCEWWKVTE